MGFSWAQSKYVPTFTEGLCSRPGSIGEAHPFRGTNQIKALRAAEINLGTDLEICLFPGTMGGDARITTGPSSVTCREKKTENADFKTKIFNT